MTTGKGGGGAAAPSSSSSPQKPPECCMCGDYGLSYELFNCKICQFRSQHRYCSNLYPKAESYRVCNWCLIQRDGAQITNTPHSEKTPPGCSPNSEDDHHHLIKRKKINGGDCNNSHGGGGGGTPKGRIKDRLHSLQVASSRPIKKQSPKSPEGLPSPASRKKGGNGMEERLRRSKSEEVMNKQVIVRNKVRRYKLLDEVSSQ